MDGRGKFSWKSREAPARGLVLGIGLVFCVFALSAFTTVPERPVQPGVCEITTVILPRDTPGMTATFINFEVKKGQYVVIRDSTPFELGFDELRSGIIKETPARLTAVEKLRRRMVDQWAIPLSKGRAWYSYRYQC